MPSPLLSNLAYANAHNVDLSNPTNTLMPTLDIHRAQSAAPAIQEPVALDVHALSPDTLMFYLDTRLRAIDEQIDGIFTKQQKDETVRKALLEMQEILDPLEENRDHPNAVLQMPGYSGGSQTDIEQRLHEQIGIIKEVNPELGGRMEADLTAHGQFLCNEDGQYKGSELTATRDYLSNTGKQLESGSQLAMIQLQSLMSARQTAIQLSSNLIAAYNDSQKAVVANVR